MVSARSRPLHPSFYAQPWAALAPGVQFCWLGQAGFAVREGPFFCILDPYLSDSLASKYAGTLFPHMRMMPPPIQAGAFRGVTHVLCSHAHSDHMDPQTIPAIAAANPASCFVYPLAEKDAAIERGIPGGDRALPLAGRESVDLTPNVSLTCIPSAHETIVVDAEGNNRFLGFVIALKGCTIYHSGDCVPYEGLGETLARLKIDVAFLPVNGRDHERSSHGILGNFTFDEAAALCREARIPVMVCHHFGMFDFNSVEVPALRAAIDSLPFALQCIIPAVDKLYIVTSSATATVAPGLI